MNTRLPVTLLFGFLLLSGCGGDSAASSSTAAAASSTSSPDASTTPTSTVPDVDDQPNGGDQEPFASGDGVIVCHPLDRYGESEWRELIVVEPSGELVRSIELDLGGYGATEIHAVAGTPWVVVADVIGPGIAFVDVSTGEVRLYPDYWLMQGPPGEGRWVRLLLAGPFSDAALIDFHRGHAVDLGGILGEEGGTATMVTGGGSDNHVVVFAASQRWLIPLDDPAGARRIGPVTAADLSADGRLLYVDRDGGAYAGSVEDDVFDLVAVNVSDAWFVGDSIMLVRDDTLVLIDSEGAEVPLWESDEDLRLHRRPTVAPEGRHALVPVDYSGGIVWIHVDVDLTEATVLGRTGWAYDYAEVGRHLVMFLGGEHEGLATELAVIDVVSGGVWSASLDEGISFLTTAWSASGETLVVDGWESIHVFETATGESRSTMSRGRNPSVSPNGNEFVWEQWHGSGRGSTFDGLVISPVSDPTTTQPLGIDCAYPEWVATP